MAVLGFYGSPPGDRAPSSAYVDTRPGSTRIFQNYIANDTYTKLAAQVQGRENYWEVVIPPGLIENYKRTSFNVKNVEHYATWIASSWTTLPALTLGDLKSFSIEIGGIGKGAMYGATVNSLGVTRSSSEYQDIYNDPWGPPTILLLDRRGDILYGSQNEDYIWGYGGNDKIEAGAGDDLINGGLGADFIDGGVGLDVVIVDNVLQGPILEGAFRGLLLDTYLADLERRYGQVWTIGEDTLVNVERVQFTDKTIALDFSPGQNAYNTVMLIGAAFGKQKVNEYFPIGLSLFDSGQTVQSVAKLISDLQLIEQKIDDPSNIYWVKHVYRNLAGEEADAVTTAQLADLLSSNVFSRSELLALSLSIPSLEVQVNMIGYQSAGLSFVPLAS